MMLVLSRVQDASGSAERAEPTLAIGLTITLMLPASGPQAIAERLYVKVASSAAGSRASQEPGQRPPQITQIRRSRSLQALPGKPSPVDHFSYTRKSSTLYNTSLNKLTNKIATT